MGGGIIIAEGNYWGAAGWAYAVLRDEIVAVLAEKRQCFSLLEYLRNPAGGPMIVEGIDLRSRSTEEVIAFREAAALALERIRHRGESHWNHVAPLPNFLEHCTDLIRRLEGGRENRPQAEPRPPCRELLPPPGQATMADVERLVGAGEYLAAIRCYREIHPGTTLAAAQAAINDLRNGN